MPVNFLRLSKIVLKEKTIYLNITSFYSFINNFFCLLLLINYLHIWNKLSNTFFFFHFREKFICSIKFLNQMHRKKKFTTKRQNQSYRMFWLVTMEQYSPMVKHRPVRPTQWKVLSVRTQCSSFFLPFPFVEFTRIPKVKPF